MEGFTFYGRRVSSSEALNYRIVARASQRCASVILLPQQIRRCVLNRYVLASSRGSEECAITHIRWYRLEGMHVKQVLARATALILIAGSLVACATKPAPDFGGRWKPVNRFAETATEIPLYSSYVYQATPMDGTLKTMLERWAVDSNMELHYQVASDYTLYRAVTEIDTTSVQQATASLTAVYAKQGISVSVVANKIMVQSVVAKSGVGAPLSP